jgi:hypothetical protein
LQDLLDKVYKSARKTYGGDKGKASATAWAAAKRSGWFKSKSGSWKKKSESESSYYQWYNFWKRAEYYNPLNLERSVIDALGTVNIQEALVPFKARILLAVPGKSLNNRIYSKETLMQAAPLYQGKPFILDHDIEHAERVVGLISNPRYTVERSEYTGEAYEGLWSDAVGYMDPDLFQKMKGSRLVPPLIRGVSIGGQGDGDYNVDGGTLIKNFNPAELSVTAFPGIPQAHMATIQAIAESYRQQGLLSKSKMKTEVSLEEAEAQASAWKKKIRELKNIPIREGPIMPSIPPNRPALRGANTVPDSIPRIPVTWTHPQPTTASQTGISLDPQSQQSSTAPFQSVGANQYAGLKGQSSTEQAPGTAGSPGSKDAKAWPPKTPKVGRTTTQTPGFGNQSPSGTGLADQDEEEESRQKALMVQGLQADMAKLLTIMRTGTEAKVDISKPEEEEEEEKKGEEEEEEEERVIMRILVKKQLAREGNANLGDQSSPINRATSYSRTIFGPGRKATHSPPNETEPGQMKALYSAGSKPAAYAPQEAKVKAEDEEEEEEERVLWNRLLQLRYQREAAPGQEPRANAPIPKTPKLGYSTTKTPGFGKLRPSGTGIGDQDEEEEEMITLNGVRYRREQSGASDVDKDIRPEKEEEEESMPRMPTDLLKPQSPEPNLMKIQRDPDMDGDQDFVAANPIRSGGEEEEEHARQLANAVQSARGFSAPDSIPIEGRAPSMPLGAGISKLLDTLIPRGPSEADQARMVEMWRKGKEPKYSPIQKIMVNTNLGKEPVLPKGAGSIVPTLRGVPAKGMMSIAPTIPYQSQSQGVRDISRVAESVMDRVQRRPFARYNLGHQIWLEMLPEVLEVR